MAFELREKTWKLGCTTGHGHKPRERMGAARHPARLLQEGAEAKKRCGLLETAPVVRCYAAGRESVWRHGFLPSHGITNHVVDSSAIAVKRRKRRAKRAAVDVRKLVRMLMRYAHGAREVGRVVHEPSVDAEDGRPLHRDGETLKRDRASTTTRIQGLLSSQGIRLTRLHKCPAQLEALRLWDGSPLPRGRRRRLLRGYAHPQFLSHQIAALEAARRAVLQSAQDASSETVRQLLQLKGIGINGAWSLVREFFAWRECKNRREVGG
jgi:transposase